MIGEIASRGAGTDDGDVRHAIGYSPFALRQKLCRLLFVQSFSQHLRIQG
jgi:hypothetical protein